MQISELCVDLSVIPLSCQSYRSVLLFTFAPLGAIRISDFRKMYRDEKHYVPEASDAEDLHRSFISENTKRTLRRGVMTGGLSASEQSSYLQETLCFETVISGFVCVTDVQRGEERQLSSPVHHPAR